jgi:ribosomal protein S18 acetylase RimI-like enzyme
LCASSALGCCFYKIINHLKNLQSAAPMRAADYYPASVWFCFYLQNLTEGSSFHVLYLIDVHHQAFQAAYLPLAANFDSNFVQATNQNYFESAWAKHFANPTHSILGLWQSNAAQDYNQLMGFCCYGPADTQKLSMCDLLTDKTPQNYAELYQIYLLPQARGHGAGRALMQLMRANLRSESFEQILIDVYSCNKTAISFYQKQGAQLARSEFLDSETRQNRAYHNPSAHYVMSV